MKHAYLLLEFLIFFLIFSYTFSTLFVKINSSGLITESVKAFVISTSMLFNFYFTKILFYHASFSFS